MSDHPDRESTADREWRAAQKRSDLATREPLRVRIKYSTEASWASSLGFVLVFPDERVQLWAHDGLIYQSQALFTFSVPKDWLNDQICRRMQSAAGAAVASIER